MKTEKASKVQPLFDIFVDAINFIIIQYVLGCFLIAFKTSPFSILLFATKFYVISQYWSTIKQKLDGRKEQWVIFLISIAIYVALMAVFGYFPISITLKNFQ